MTVILALLTLILSMGMGAFEGLKYSFAKNIERSLPYTWRKFDTRVRISVKRLWLERIALSLAPSLLLFVTLFPLFILQFDPQLEKFVEQETNAEARIPLSILLCLFGNVVSSNLIIVQRWHKEKRYNPNS